MMWLASITLALLLGAHYWLYLDRVGAPFDGDLGSVRYIVAQLAEDLSDLNEKNARLQREMKHLSGQLDVSSGGVERMRVEMFGSRAQPDRPERGDHRDGVRDFALESAGALIVDTGATADYVLDDSPVAWLMRALTATLCRGCDGARTMLQPGAMPGECWAFRGSRGEAVVQLLGSVNVTGVTLEHISPEVAPTGDISSAPRRFQVEGLESLSAKYGYSLGTFEYDRDGWPIQYFAVERPAPHYFHLVRLRFLSNWGHPQYTCVYRVRVHGELEPGQGHIGVEPPPTAEDVDF